MKAKNGFNLRSICGEQIIVAEGLQNIDFSNIIRMNESSAYLWRNIQNRDSFTAEDLCSLLTEEYEVDEETALRDAREIAQQWIGAGIVEN